MSTDALVARMRAADRPLDAAMLADLEEAVGEGDGGRALWLAFELRGRGLAGARAAAGLLGRIDPTTVPDPLARIDLLVALAVATNLHLGLPAAANRLFAEADELAGRLGTTRSAARQASLLGVYGKSLRQAGLLDACVEATRRALALHAGLETPQPGSRAVLRYWLGTALAEAGDVEGSAAELDAALSELDRVDAPQARAACRAFRAQRALWLGDPTSARLEAAEGFRVALEVAETPDLLGAVKVLASCARMAGEAAFGLGEHEVAGEHLDDALALADLIDMVEEQLPARLVLARLAVRRGELEAASAHLDHVEAVSAAGPYPSFAAQAAAVRVVLGSARRAHPRPLWSTR